MASPLYRTGDLRRIEQAASGSKPPLMERAGSAAADLAAALASEKTKDILVLAGPGNNGGDARIAAERLKERFFRVTIATTIGEIPAATAWGLIIDGLFGIGLKRPIASPFAELVAYANQQRCPVLSLDVPSGIDSDTGAVLGSAIRATHTITFIAMKPGLVTLDGPDYAGEIAVADLGLDCAALCAPSAWIVEPSLFPGALRRRPRNFHKGLAGSLAILGGGPGMNGAALLAGRAAIRIGAGRVYVGLLDERAPSVDPHALELMLRHADDALGQDLDAIVVGPGIGQSERAETLLGAALASELPCVLDADALNLLSENDDLRKACARRAAETLLTPHPAEAARLLGSSVADVQSDRIDAARRLSDHFNAQVVLKGNGSVVAGRDGRWFINTTGNPGLASAGTGDVLAGMLGALLAQGYPADAALALGVHLHGAAADTLVRSGLGPVGLTAGELIDPARRLLNTWLR